MKNKLLIAIILLLSLGSCNRTNNEKVEVSFEKLNTNTNVSIRALHVVNENTIWASGSNGTVLLSNDGGNTWDVHQVKGAEENDFRSIHAWDNRFAMVFGVSGPDFGYQTVDGGKNWKVVYSDTTNGLFFNSVKFTNSFVGLAVSDPIDGKVFVLRTEFAGERWNRIENMPEVIAGEANFAASNGCIDFHQSGKAWIASGGKAARVFYSTNFGKNWQVAETPILHGEAATGIFSIAFKNDLEGAVVGGNYSKPEENKKIAAYTNDGGKTWSLSSKMPQEYRSSVQTLKIGNENYFVAFGKTGCDISLDGKNWNFLSHEGFYTFRAVPDKMEGFAAGADGKISKVIFSEK